MKLLKKVFLGLVIICVVAQFFRPEKNVGNVDSLNAFLEETQPPKDVKLILEGSCYDCHSDVTQYPWYNHITPINYWLAGHIKEGKKHFNLSNWEGNSVRRKDHKFEELIEMVEDKSMPLKSYTLTHSDAKLSETQIKWVIHWANLVRLKYSFTPRPD
ncbi:heme-binding domain-containing protein [Cognatitamlana onchidii]|uniref:heme-binding domain-containing protein n=1 Tax=Cognatitamlana onchidii TaxID=2562860 RepID=UPI0010A5E47A|nr:heme-binding domain-containing protein [Algibacter onchidii]